MDGSVNPGAASRWQRLGFVLGPLLFLAFLWVLPQPEGLDSRGQRVLAIGAWMATWWVTEAVPIAVTSMLPLLLFPLLGVLTSENTARQYANDLIYLFFGGFFLSLGLERWNLHRRLALRVIALFGTKPRGLVLGMMTAVAVTSMWVSNTASVLMMLPIAVALIDETHEAADVDRRRRFGLSLLLGCAYAASIGGMGTPIGTPTNGVFLRVLADRPLPSFLQWMAFGIPLVAVQVLVAWLILVRLIYRLDTRPAAGGNDSVRRRIQELGPMSREERAVLVVFALTVFLWVFRSDIGGFPGWVHLARDLGLSWLEDGSVRGIGDSVAATLAVLLLCTVRVRRGGEALVDWKAARDLPWGMLLLFGGGFALAEGFRVGDAEGTSLSHWVAAGFQGLGSIHPFLLVLCVSVAISFLSEIASNTATAAVALPILAQIGGPEESRLLCLAATLAASNGYMLPVATPPNTIVFATGRVSQREMIRAGFLVDLSGILAVALGVHYLAPWVLP